MKHLKIFEDYYIGKDGYIIYPDLIATPKTKHFFVNDIFKYLGVSEFPYDEKSIGYNPYGIDTIDFLKEIFLNKKIKFTSLEFMYGNHDTKITKIPKIEGVVEDVDLFGYKELYVKVKINNKWYIINSNIVTIYNYDAENKELHKDLIIAKDAKRFNL